jgi:DNA-binding HxlR family transcriptional regulator
MARALDVVGERWALLVVRELLLGPRRFADLRAGLSNVSSNLLADRLRELQEHGVLHRRMLGAPAASWVYELTERGRSLEPILVALGDWGLQFPVPASPSLSGTSVLIYLQAHLKPVPNSRPVTIHIDLDGQPWTARVRPDGATVRSGEPDAADLTLATTACALDDLLHNPNRIDAALRKRGTRLTGDRATLARILARLS